MVRDAARAQKPAGGQVFANNQTDGERGMGKFDYGRFFMQDKRR